MEMETSARMHDSKPMGHDNDDADGAGTFASHSPSDAYLEAALTRSDGKLQRGLNGKEATSANMSDSISSSVDPDPIAQNDHDDHVSEYVNVQGESDPQNTLKSRRSLRSTNRNSSKLMDGNHNNFMDSLHDPSGFAIDPALGARVSTTQSDGRILRSTSHNNGYKRSQEQSEEAAAVALTAGSQTEYFRQQQIQAQVELQRQRQLHQLAQTPKSLQQLEMQHAQQQAYLSKQTQSYMQQQAQLQQISTEADELFRQVNPGSVQTPGAVTRQRSMRHSQGASPYAGREMMPGEYTPAGNLTGLLTQFGDSIDVSGMDFGQSSPMGSQMAMIPPPPPGSNGGTPGPSGSGRKRKASSMGSIGGDSDAIAELKVMAKNSMGNSLVDLAVRVREEEVGSSAEKYKQIFAMTWLKKNCELSPDAAVPRNRIYARYVELCAEYSLKPLNPASFGKLVRVAYPGIKTRRLGVRGQSKYHYCGFRLIGEQNNPTGNTPTGTPGRFGNSPDSVGMKNHFENGQLVFPAQSPHSTPSQVRFRSTSTPVSEFDSKLSREGLDEFTQVGSTDMGQVSDLRFHNSFSDFADISLSSTAHEAFTIPRLEKFLTSEIDPDFTTTLYSLYLAHCRGLVEALRFMHIKKFLNSMGSFVGVLTAPIQKLLANEEVAVWIAHADWAMYKVRILAVSRYMLTNLGNGTNAESASSPGTAGAGGCGLEVTSALLSRPFDEYARDFPRHA